LFITPNMLALAATLFLGLAAALPARDLIAPQVQAEGPSSVKIHGVSLLGSGCPSGTADVQVDASGELFEATFSAYEIQTGPGTKAADWRKNCKLTMNLEFQRGFQYVRLCFTPPSLRFPRRGKKNHRIDMRR
jgi:hypothetical protein